MVVFVKLIIRLKVNCLLDISLRMPNFTLEKNYNVKCLSY